MANILFVGPPATGKSTALLDQFLSLERSGAEPLLLTPTATMAEHVQHELARSGHAVRPSRIRTLGSLIDSRTPRMKTASPAALALRAGEALERVDAAEFREVAGLSGFRRTLADAIGEIGASPEAAERLLAGGVPGPYTEAIRQVFQETERLLRSAGLSMRHRRVTAAAAAGGDWPPHILLDGFFTLRSGESRVLRQAAAHASLTITLPSREAAAGLDGCGFEVRTFPQRRRTARTEVRVAPTVPQEANYIAERIVEAVRQGRAFRDIGVIVRSRQPYEAALRSAFARWDIPHRSYFANRLEHHPAVGAILGLLRAIASGESFDQLLTALRTGPWGLANAGGDELAFAVEQRIPDHGLAKLADLSPPLAPLLELGIWANDSAEPSEWASRLASAAARLPPPDPPAGHADALAIQAHWTALAALAEAAREASEAVRGRRLSLAAFLDLMEDAVASTPLRAPDFRRNVVHILDAFEARQWELPLVFVCGLLERGFPQYPAPDPLLPESARRAMGLPSADEFREQERQLFDSAVSRASGETVLTYPRADEKGEELLPSRFLPGPGEPIQPPASPRPRWDAMPPNRDAAIRDPELRERRAAGALSPSAVEDFLQCPFKYHARRALRLRMRPPAPDERLNVLEQGSLMHALLQRDASSGPLFRDNVFDEVFEEACQRLRVPLSYRREAIRQEMLRNFEAFRAAGFPALGWKVDTEVRFEFALGETRITGRVDRLETGPAKQALVIDYKYSGAPAIKDAVSASDAGTRVQGGLYLIGVERGLGLKAAGMLYCGVRGDVTWNGWHAIAGLNIAGLNLGEHMLPSGLREVMARAEELTVRAADQIRAGQAAAAPADADKCRWCEYRDICRVESKIPERLTQVAHP